MKKENIAITCYGRTEMWDSREKAEAFYLEAMMMCEGSERDRYTNIYTQLKMGQNECSDEMD